MVVPHRPLTAVPDPSPGPAACPATAVPPAAAGVRRALTRRQRDLLGEIVRYVAVNGYPPSVRELGAAVGLSSTNTVAHHLHALERAGYLRRVPGRPRALQVLPPKASS